MKKSRIFLLLFFGIIIGLVLYNRLELLISNPSNDEISLVDSAVARNVQTELPAAQLVSGTRQNAITRAIETVSPAVVSVNVTKIEEYIQRSPFSSDPFLRDFFPELYRSRRIQRPVASVGSGFLISADGYIVTNEHVVEHATEIIISMSDGSEYSAVQIGSDHITDIALLKIEGSTFPLIRFGDSDELIIGEWAIALGNPFGLFIKKEPTVTVGVISAINRDFGLMEGRVYQDMIQTDASINSGNSGGPLCNADGEIIGMNTFIFSPSQRQTQNRSSSSGSVGIGFAIPINRIDKIVQDLKQNMQVDRDFWLGLYYRDLNRFVARELGYDSQDGVYIARIDRRSPADKAGFKLGDIILEINRVNIKNTKDVENAVLSTYPKVGDILDLKIWRNDRFQSLKLTLEKTRR